MNSINISDEVIRKLDEVRSDEESYNELILRLLRHNTISKNKTAYTNPLLPSHLKKRNKDRMDRIRNTGNQFSK